MDKWINGKKKTVFSVFKAKQNKMEITWISNGLNQYNFQMKTYQFYI